MFVYTIVLFVCNANCTLCNGFIQLIYYNGNSVHMFCEVLTSYRTLYYSDHNPFIVLENTTITLVVSGVDHN